MDAACSSSDGSVVRDYNHGRMRMQQSASDSLLAAPNVAERPLFEAFVAFVDMRSAVLKVAVQFQKSEAKRMDEALAQIGPILFQSSAESPPELLTPGTIVLITDADGKYYRGRILSTNALSKAEVLLIDSGCCMNDVDPLYLRVLGPEFVKIAQKTPLAVFCVVKGLRCATGYRWSAEATDFIAQHLLQKDLLLEIHETVAGEPIVELYNMDDVDRQRPISEQLVRGGFALRTLTVIDPAVGSDAAVLVSHLENGPHSFFLWSLSDVNVQEWLLLCEQLKRCYAAGRPLTCASPGRLCLAPVDVTEAQQICRVKILSVSSPMQNEPQTASLFLCDYGMTTDAELSSLYELPTEFTRLPAQAIWCRLCEEDLAIMSALPEANVMRAFWEAVQDRQRPLAARFMRKAKLPTAEEELFEVSLSNPGCESSIATAIAGPLAVGLTNVAPLHSLEATITAKQEIWSDDAAFSAASASSAASTESSPVKRSQSACSRDAIFSQTPPKAEPLRSPTLHGPVWSDDAAFSHACASSAASIGCSHIKRSQSACSREAPFAKTPPKPEPLRSPTLQRPVSSRSSSSSSGSAPLAQATRESKPLASVAPNPAYFLPKFLAHFGPQLTATAAEPESDIVEIAFSRPPPRERPPLPGMGRARPLRATPGPASPPRMGIARSLRATPPVSPKAVEVITIDDDYWRPALAPSVPPRRAPEKPSTGTFKSAGIIVLNQRKRDREATAVAQGRMPNSSRYLDVEQDASQKANIVVTLSPTERSRSIKAVDSHHRPVPFSQSSKQRRLDRSQSQTTTLIEEFSFTQSLTSPSKVVSASHAANASVRVACRKISESFQADAAAQPSEWRKVSFPISGTQFGPHLGGSAVPFSFVAPQRQPSQQANAAVSATATTPDIASTSFAVSPSLAKPAAAVTPMTTSTSRAAEAASASSSNNSNAELVLPEAPAAPLPRPIVIDGLNVAFGHGCDRICSCRGIWLTAQYWRNKGHKIYVVIPKGGRFAMATRCSVTEYELIEQLDKRGEVKFSPTRKIPRPGQQGKWKTLKSYDDNLIVQIAHLVGGVIISNDNFRDVMASHPEWQDTLNKRVIGHTWVDDVVIFPSDPFGRGAGPSLDELVRFPPGVVPPSLVASLSTSA